ncbi:MAG: Lactose transport system permease protein LacF [Syntrophomonadaceae bacterium]|nr:Lactose transport system permease protein LacF [Bacillota bacterium]
MTKLERRDFRNGLIFVSPWLVGFLIFILYPIISSFYYSLTDYNILQPPVWVGLANYERLLFEDPLFWKSLENTLFMVLFGLPLMIIGSLGIALLLNAKVKAMSIHRTIFYLPSVIPDVAGAILWLWILNPMYGPITTMLQTLGISSPGWLTDPEWSKPSLLFMGLWGLGAGMIMYLASLQDVPEQLYESAKLDGARTWHRFWYITLPMISPVIFFSLVMGLIGWFGYFTAVFIMTGGGPAFSTLTYALYLYQNAFVFWRMGYASAQAWILFGIVLVATIAVFKTSTRWVYYAGESK